GERTARRVEETRRGDEKDVTGCHRNRERAAIQAALQRLNLKGDAIVIDTITAMQARATIFSRIIKANPWAEIIRVPAALPMQERQNNRIELADAADVLDVGIEFIPQANIQSEL